MNEEKVELREDIGALSSKFLARKLKEVEKYQEIREDLAAFIKDELTEEVDYGITDKRSKAKTLKKPGAEKICQLLGVEPVFLQDEGTWKMMGEKPGTTCLVCYLMTHEAKLRAIELVACGESKDAQHVISMLSVAEGRGCGSLEERGNAMENDITKITQKRAQVDATLRLAGLSDEFTQDLEDPAYDDSKDNDKGDKKKKSDTKKEDTDAVDLGEVKNDFLG